MPRLLRSAAMALGDMPCMKNLYMRRITWASRSTTLGFPSGPFSKPRKFLYEIMTFPSLNLFWMPPCDVFGYGAAFFLSDILIKERWRRLRRGAPNINGYSLLGMLCSGWDEIAGWHDDSSFIDTSKSVKSASSSGWYFCWNCRASWSASSYSMISPASICRMTEMAVW